MNGRSLAAPFLCGVVVAAGLALSGMTNPHKVIGFLDVGGRWDPTLLFVMLGAVSVHAVLFRKITRLPAPLSAPAFSIPTRRDLDPPLVLGAALFGVGWGLSGYCPGPVICSLIGGGAPALVFAAAMLSGMGAYGWLDRDRGTVPAAGEVRS